MTKTIMLSAIGISAILVVLLPFMPQASADDTSCIGILAAGTYENVIVPAGFSCFFSSGVTVNGNVDVENGAVFNAFGSVTVNGNINVASGASIHVHSLTLGGNVEGTNCSVLFFDSLDTAIGNVKSDGCMFVIIGNSSIGGDVQVKNSGNTSIRSNTIGGNLQIEDNTGVRVGAFSNSVFGDLQYNGNTSTTTVNPSIVGSNTVLGNLQCSGNSPAAAIAPFGLNTVSGDKEGECTSL